MDMTPEMVSLIVTPSLIEHRANLNLETDTRVLPEICAGSCWQDGTYVYHIILHVKVRNTSGNKCDGSC